MIFLVFQRIEYYDQEIKVELNFIKKHFKDEVSYKVSWQNVSILLLPKYVFYKHGKKI